MSAADARPGNAPVAAPYDAALPGAVLLRQPRRLVEVLSPLLAGWLEPGARLVDGHVAIRRYVPGKRCICELELVIAPGGAGAVAVRTVIGKLYAGEEGAQVYDTLHRLWVSGFSTEPLTVPRPIAYDPDWHLLLLSRVTGTALRHLLLATPSLVADGRREAEGGSCPSSPAGHLSPSAVLFTAVERSAAWLVKLHTSGVTVGRRYTFDRHLHTLAHWQRRVVDVYPEAEPLLATILARIEARGRALPAWEPAPTHRDFSPDHIVVDGARLSGLDFDEFCQYDPLFDVAHFVGHVRLLALTSSGTLHRFDELATRFTRAYEAQAKDYSAARVRLYEAITYLKLVHIVARITRPRGWQQAVALLLREAQAFV